MNESRGGGPPRFERHDLIEAREALFSQTRPVGFQHVDAAGTIFFPRVLEYFSDVYLGMLLAGGIDVAGALREGAWAAPLAHAEADYLAPMRFGDTVVVEVVKTRVGRTSIGMGYRARSEGGACLAVGQTAHVVVDATTFAPTPVPDDVRRALSGKAT